MRCLVLISFLLGGCAQVQPTQEKPLGPGEVRSAQTAKDLFSTGKSTKRDVLDALGPATVVDFASGYEIWVYRQPPREKPPAAGAELVLLFDPAGVLTRARVR